MDNDQKRGCNRERILSSLFVLAVMLPVVAVCEEKLQVTATLTTFADIARQVGGDAVEVKSVASPRFNAHFIEPKPSDVLKVKRTDLLLHGGLDLEAWLDSLVNAAGRADLKRGGERQLDLSIGVHLEQIPAGPVSRSQGDIHLYGNPHFWGDPRNGRVMARAIAEKLSELDPARAPGYKARSAEFLERLEQKIVQWSALSKTIAGREIVGYHNEWIYLSTFMGLEISQYLEPKPGIPPTPGQLERLTVYMRERGIRTIVTTSFYPRDAADALGGRTGASIVTLVQNAGETAETGDYISMLDYNIRTLVASLES